MCFYFLKINMIDSIHGVDANPLYPERLVQYPERLASDLVSLRMSVDPDGGGRGSNSQWLRIGNVTC